MTGTVTSTDRPTSTPAFPLERSHWGNHRDQPSPSSFTRPDVCLPPPPRSKGLFTTYHSLVRVLPTPPPHLRLKTHPSSPSPQNGNIISPKKKSDSLFFVFLGSAPRVIIVFYSSCFEVCILSSCPPKRMFFFWFSPSKKTPPLPPVQPTLATPSTNITNLPPCTIYTTEDYSLPFSGT